MLNQHERGDRRKKHGEANQHDPRHQERRLLGRLAQQKRHADHDKQQLRHDPDGDVDDHSGRGLRARHAALMNEPCARQIATDGGHGQERADRFSDPAVPDRTDNARTTRQRQQLTP